MNTKSTSGENMPQGICANCRPLVSSYVTKEREGGLNHLEWAKAKEEGRAAERTALVETVKERLCALAATNDPLKAIDSIERSIFGRNPPDSSPTKHQIMGQIRALTDIYLFLLHSVQ